MKKQILIFSLFIALPMLGVAGNSSEVTPLGGSRISEVSGSDVVIFSEGFESATFPTGWSALTADADTFGWGVSTLKAHTGTRCMASASYISFIGPYQIGALFPNNYLISPQITIPAGVSAAALDYYISASDSYNPREHYSVYVSVTEPMDTNSLVLLTSETLSTAQYGLRTVNLSSYVGSTIRLVFRHHDCTDQFSLVLDDVTVYTTSTPMVTADKDSFKYVSYVGSEEIRVLGVESVAVTGNITATTVAPFSISSDGTNYSQSVSLGTSASTLYVKFEPTAEGFYNENLFLTSTGAKSDTVLLSGKASDCRARTSDFEEVFTDSSFSLTCWNVYDANNDGTTFYKGKKGYLSSTYIFAYRYSQYRDADDWLISPLFNIQRGDSLHIEYVCPYGDNYDEQFQLFVLPENYDLNQPQDSLSPTQLVYNTYAVQESYSLQSYANQRVHIAVHCTSLKNNGDLQITGFGIKNYYVEVGVGETAQQELLLYPNPVKDVLYFSNQADMVWVYNMTGQLLIEKKMIGETSLSVSEFPAGIYTVRVASKNGIQTQRIIKQ